MGNKEIKRKMLHDRKLPDSEQIKKHQNFERINSDYSVIKKLLMKKIFLWSGALIGVAAIVGIVILKKDSPKTTTEKTATTEIVENKIPCVLPPFPGEETPFSVYRVSSKNNSTITHTNGSTIEIPANAFTKQNGEAVSDSVDIKYREFHNPLDIFLSGIPMNYDSAGTAYTLESAGMLEIKGFDGTEELSLKKDKSININMMSSNNESRFNLYALDTTTKNWMYKGNDKIEKPITASTIAENKTDSKTTIQPEQKMVKPILSNPQKYSFNISYDAASFPELAAYDGVLFEVTDTNFNPAYFKVNWDKISLSNGTEQGLYIVKLKKKDSTVSVNACPVFDQENYSKALAEFEKKHNRAVKESNMQEIEKQTKLSTVNNNLASYNRSSMRTVASNLSALGSVSYNTTIIRTFPIFSFGIHNCDFPMPPNPIVQFANAIALIGGNKKELAYSDIFMIEKGKNTVFRFAKNEPVRCNLKAENLVWTVTNTNEIAFFNPTDFSSDSPNNKKEILPTATRNQDIGLKEIRLFLE
jgi:hypothetical protein